MPRRRLSLVEAAPDTGAAGLSLSLRVRFGSEQKIGPGKIALLEAIGRTGSISAAGRSMTMSYRRAWQLVDAVNRMFDTPSVIASAGGSFGGGAVLTPFGQQLVEAYRRFEKRMIAAAQDDFGEVLPRLAQPQRDTPAPDGEAGAGMAPEGRLRG